MLLEDLYTKVHKNGIYNGSAFCVTTTHRVLEIMLFNKVIVNIKALAMTPEQVVDLFQTGTFKDINIVPKEVAVPMISERMFTKLFPLSANYLFDPNWISIAYVVRMLDIMDLLAKSSTGPGPSYTMIRNTVSEKCPGLSFAKETLLERIDAFEQITGISLQARKDPLPLKEHQILSWALTRTASKDRLMQSFVRYCVFWGETSPSFSKALIREDKGADRKPGTAGVSMQDGAAQYRYATLYRGLDKVTRLELVEEKKGSYMSPEARLASFGNEKQNGALELSIASQELSSLGIRNCENLACLIE